MLSSRKRSQLSNRKQILSPKLQENSVSGVARHNICQTSAVISNLLVVTAKNRASGYKVCCRKKKESGNNTIHQVTATLTPGATPRVAEEDTDCPFRVYLKSVESSGNSSITPSLYQLTVAIQDKEVTMKVDTGSSVTLLNSTDFSKLGGQLNTLKPPTVILKSYTGNVIQCFGEKEMNVKVGDQVGTQLIRVVQGPSLLGRDMMSKLIIPWLTSVLFQLQLRILYIYQYPDLFDTSSVGKLKGIQVSLQVRNENPVFTKPRVASFAIQSKYESKML